MQKYVCGTESGQTGKQNYRLTLLHNNNNYGTYDDTSGTWSNERYELTDDDIRALKGNLSVETGAYTNLDLASNVDTLTLTSKDPSIASRKVNKGEIDTSNIADWNPDLHQVITNRDLSFACNVIFDDFYLCSAKQNTGVYNNDSSIKIFANGYKMQLGTQEVSDTKNRGLIFSHLYGNIGRGMLDCDIFGGASASTGKTENNNYNNHNTLKSYPNTSTDITVYAGYGFHKIYGSSNEVNAHTFNNTRVLIDKKGALLFFAEEDPNGFWGDLPYDQYSGVVGGGKASPVSGKTTVEIKRLYPGALYKDEEGIIYAMRHSNLDVVGSGFTETASVGETDITVDMGTVAIDPEYLYEYMFVYGSKAGPVTDNVNINVLQQQMWSGMDIIGTEERETYNSNTPTGSIGGNLTISALAGTEFGEVTGAKNGTISGNCTITLGANTTYWSVNGAANGNRTITIPSGTVTVTSGMKNWQTLTVGSTGKATLNATGEFNSDGSGATYTGKVLLQNGSDLNVFAKTTSEKKLYIPDGKTEDDYIADYEKPWLWDMSWITSKPDWKPWEQITTAKEKKELATKLGIDLSNLKPIYSNDALWITTVTVLEETRKIGNLEVNGSGSTLRVYKAQPLTIDGSKTGQNLIVGLKEGQGPGSKTPIIKFTDTTKANRAEYTCLADYAQTTEVINDPIGTIALNRYQTMWASQMKVEHINAPDDYSNSTITTQKKLTFWLECNVTEGNSNGAYGSPIAAAYVSTSPTPEQIWLENGIVVNGAEVKLNHVRLYRTYFGTVESADIQEPNATARYYYLHVKNEDGTVKTILLDLESPELSSSTTTVNSNDDSGTVTINLKDKLPTTPDNAPASLTYTQHGIKEIAWALDTVKDAESIKNPFEDTDFNGSGMGVQKPAVTITGSQLYTYTISLPSGSMNNDKILYLYVRDTLGNIGKIQIPLGNSTAEIKVPLKVSTIALKGYGKPQLLSPNLTAENFGKKSYKVELALYETSNNNELTFVNKEADFSSTEMNLKIKQLDTFLPLMQNAGWTSTSVVDITDTQPLLMGTLSKKDTAGNRVAFTFEALYDDTNIPNTSSWSICYLKWRLTPVTNEPTAP